jgi:hypothetical protein
MVMPKIPEKIFKLDPEKIKSLHIFVCKRAYFELRKFALEGGELSYSVESSSKAIDLSLLERAFESVSVGRDTGFVTKSFEEIRKDIHNRSMSFKFNEDYYQLWCSIINLYELYVEGKSHSTGIIIRQALMDCDNADFSNHIEAAYTKYA